MTESMSAYAAGVAPQWGASASPRTYRYAPVFEPDHDSWRNRAACIGAWSAFHPEKGETSNGDLFPGRWREWGN